MIVCMTACGSAGDDKKTEESTAAAAEQTTEAATTEAAKEKKLLVGFCTTRLSESIFVLEQKALEQIFEGKGNVFGLVAGIFVMQIIANGMQLAQWGTYLQYAVKGTILLAAIIFDVLKNRPKPVVRIHKDKAPIASKG